MRPPVQAIVVMKQPGNLQVTSRVLSADSIQAHGVSSEQELERLLGDGCNADVALVDITGFGAAAWRMCAALQSCEIPFIVLSGPADLGSSSRTLKFGATSILQKPIAKSALLQLIRGLLE